MFQKAVLLYSRSRISGRQTAQHHRNNRHFGTFLNVNIPNRPLTEIAGIRFSRQGVGLLSEYVEKRTDPRNRTYYWQGRDMQSFGDDPEIDGAALDQNFISITPVKCDMTDYCLLEDLRSWGLGKLNIDD